ncbi:MAG: hypothetical protein ACRDA3_00725 [Peptostreptococcaceae bacterium]
MVQNNCNQNNTYTCGNFAPLTAAQLQIFNTAIGNILGTTYVPLLVLEKCNCQTVYYYIAQKTVVTSTPVTSVVLVTVNVNCSGVISLVSTNPINICVREISTNYNCPCSTC